MFLFMRQNNKLFTCVLSQKPENNEAHIQILKLNLLFCFFVTQYICKFNNYILV